MLLPFSLPRHNCSRDLPDELPADLATARLVWVCRDAVRAPLQRPYDGPFTVVARSPRAFTIRIRTRDAVSYTHLTLPTNREV